MQTIRRTLWFILSFICGTSLSAVAQTVIATVPVGSLTSMIAVNPVTNKIYVGTGSGNIVTVINGADDFTATVGAGFSPFALAVNSVTDKIYVADYSTDGVTIIDGATNNTSRVPVSGNSFAIAVNSVTNKVYALAYGVNGAGIVNVIDGTTLATTTVPVGTSPSALAVDSAANKIYAVSYNNPGQSPTVTVIDGATLATTSVPVGTQPGGIAVNPKTNKIYVANSYDNTVTAIDGAMLSTRTIPTGGYPLGVAVNPATNKIYIGNNGGSSVTVLDGITLTTTTVPVGGEPISLAVEPVTDKIYVVNQVLGQNSTLTMIDGITNSTNTVTVGMGSLLAVNPATNRVYVPVSATNGPDVVVVVAGPDSSGMQFKPAPPCRVVDTRNPNGPFGGPPIAGGTSRDFALPSGPCSIPSTAVAYSLNVTVVPNGSLGYLTVWPAGGSRPVVSTLNSLDGNVKANAAIVPAGSNHAVSVYATDTTNVVLDIDGYFVPAPDSSASVFYPLTPCRVADTRNPDGPLGGPYLPAGQPRDFPVLAATTCGIPDTAEAYSMNFTVVPKGYRPLGYLTIWPSGGNRPIVSTLNDPTGTIVANAGIVPAGTGGDIDAYATADTDLIIDINGYFAPARPGGLSLFSTWPCRSLDTRRGAGLFSGTMAVDVLNSLCGVSYAAQAYLLNATVVPSGSLGYLTLWQNGADKPLASTLNAADGAIRSNMAVVPTNNGLINAYASSATQLLLDVSSYFATPPSLMVLTPSLPVATLGVPYGANLTASGGVPPYSWGISSGLLPAGLSLNASTGAITGTPTDGGLSNFTAQVMDSEQAPLTAMANLSIGVQAEPLTITTSFLPPATVGIPYSAQLVVTGGVPPYVWQLTTGRLPAGLTLDPNSGLISGTLTTYDIESFVVLAADSNPAQDLAVEGLGIAVNQATVDDVLEGTYSFSLNGYQNGRPFFVAGSFYADGTGDLGRGVIDMNSAGGPTNETFTGTYTIQGNGLGTMSFYTSQGTLNYLVSVSNRYQGTLTQGTLIQDNADPQQRGSGTFSSQSIFAFSLSAIAGEFAFGSTGADSHGNPLGAVGAFQLDGNGNLTNGERDTNDNGTVSNQSFTGTLNAPDSQTGRGTATFTAAGVITHYAYYIASNQHLSFIGIDPVSDSSPLLLGAAIGQPNGWSFADASLNEIDVLELTGVSQGNSDLIAGLATTDGQGNISLSFDENAGGNLSSGMANGTYSVGANGRVTTSGLGDESQILYLTGQSLYTTLPAALVLGTDPTVKSGVAETQFGSQFSNATLQREYLGGTIMKAVSPVTDAVDWLFADGNGNMDLLEYYSGSGGTGSSGFNGAYQIERSGRGVITASGSQQAILYMVSQTKCILMPVTAEAALKVLQARQGY